MTPLTLDQIRATINDATDDMMAALLRDLDWMIEAGYDIAVPTKQCAYGHYWVDAPGAEEGWYCSACGLTEYPAAALAAIPDPLDVERLARAISIVHETDPAYTQGPARHSREQAAEHFAEWMLDAETYAREYAALAKSKEDDR